jgi:hypothetical protein
VFVGSDHAQNRHGRGVAKLGENTWFTKPFIVVPIAWFQPERTLFFLQIAVLEGLP